MINRIPLLGFCVVAALCGIVYICGRILTPFIFSLVISYMLYPAATFLETKFRLKRWLIALILVTFILSVLLTLATVILPLIYQQALVFIKLVPEYKALLDNKIMHTTTTYLDKLNPAYINKIRAASANLMVTSFDSIVNFLEKIWASGFVIVDFLWFIILVPFITFHMIKDWNLILSHIMLLIPRKRAKMMGELFSNLNNAVAGAIRGQFNVCLIVAIYYTVTLSMIKLHHGPLLGVTTGIISFVPFLGTFTGLLLSLIVAYLQFGTFKIIFYVLGIFSFGILVDSVIISPNIVGRKIGLHPVWVIFSILLGGKLLGLTGTLLALPLGAIANVLIRTALGFYYKSNLYKANEKAKRIAMPASN